MQLKADDLGELGMKLDLGFVPDYDVIAAVKVGNGGIDAVAVSRDGTVKKFWETSVRCEYAGKSLGLGKMEKVYDYVEIDGVRFATGDDALMIREGIEANIGGIEKYGNKFQQDAVATALAKMNMPSGKVHLILFCPPGFYNDDNNPARKQLERAFTGLHLEAGYCKAGKKSAKQFRYDIESVVVWPEGLMSVYALVRDEAGYLVEEYARILFSGTFEIADFGVETFDRTIFIDGVVNVANMRSLTYKGWGINLLVRQKIYEYIQSLGNDYSWVTVHDVDYVMRQGLMKNNYYMDRARLDLRTIYEDRYARYNDAIHNNVLSSPQGCNNYVGVHNVLPVGGPVQFIGDFLHKKYPDKIVRLGNFKTARGVHPASLDSHGALREELNFFRNGGHTNS